eukprot:TRINITY_DN22052_c0_g1_i1.p1 TRINITY_DN22052_c0_g1~~TRINITY_DN22052_c0_g1_i1.p1  ORF type:complete len:285 (+),score=46.36 TRINITY_DN22052_c0_g1_i1:40-894(+)
MRRCTVRLQHVADLRLHPWNTTNDDIRSNALTVCDTVMEAVSGGEGGKLRCIGAKSVIAVVKGLCLAEARIQKVADDSHEEVWGGTSKIKCLLQASTDNFHTYEIDFTPADFQFATESKIVDVLDKAEICEDIYQFATRCPSNFYNEQNLPISFDKNDPPDYSKNYLSSSSDCVDLLLQSSTQEVIVRGMGPSLFNCIKVISHAQDALALPVPFGVRRLVPTDQLVATFKDGVSEYFERGLVHFRDGGDHLPGKPADGRVVTPPEDYIEDDYFTAAFSLKVGNS